jgi:hypothetical protein
MKNEWAVLFLKPAKSDFLMIQGFIFTIGGGAILSTGHALWFGLPLAILGFVITVVTPRAVLMDLEEARNKKPEPIRKPLRGTSSFGWWRPLPKTRKHV